MRFTPEITHVSLERSRIALARSNGTAGSELRQRVGIELQPCCAARSAGDAIAEHLLREGRVTPMTYKSRSDVAERRT